MNVMNLISGMAVAVILSCLGGLLMAGRDLARGRKKKGKKYCRTAVALAGMALVTLGATLAGGTARAQQAQFQTVSFTNLAFPTAYYSTYSYTNDGTNWFFVNNANQGFNAITNTTIWQSLYYAPNSNAPALFVGNKWFPSTPVDIQLGIYAPSGTNGFFTNFLTFSPDGNYWYPSNYFLVGGQLSSGITNWFNVWLPPLTNIEWVAWDGCTSSQTNGVKIVGFKYHVMRPRY